MRQSKIRLLYLKIINVKIMQGFSGEIEGLQYDFFVSREVNSSKRHSGPSFQV